MFGRARTGGVLSAPPECNLAVLGTMGSGKSALTVKFLTRRFITEYDPYLEDTYSSEETVDQQPVIVKVMDTTDQDGPVDCERYLAWASAFLVVYSIAERHTFEGCQPYLDILALHSSGETPQPPVILLGNKVDIERYRQVSRCEGVALASRYGCLFFEVSACLDFLSVQQVFHEAVREVRRGDDREGAPLLRPLYINEDKPPSGLSTSPPLPPLATAKLVSVKSSRAQNKRRAPTLTLKGFKIF
ncbi:ras-like protein family member 12 [Conger conger]|uniref:ras-like protein family member 12 n=1 Tax=Conger conger TaxID=82655 RepID=UPI002A5A4FD8|nr:ras-like protein family member 12 [Conger conger]